MAERHDPPRTEAITCFACGGTGMLLGKHKRVLREVLVLAHGLAMSKLDQERRMTRQVDQGVRASARALWSARRR